MIIDVTYFKNKSVFIPNAVSQPTLGSNTPTAVDSLTEEIHEKERQLLIAALGNEQYLELESQFETDGAWKEDALQKWKDLVDGKDRWKGLRYTIGTKKISLIAYWVYFYYLGGDFSSYTTTGVTISDSANSTYQTPNSKQATAWNEFVKMYNGLNLGISSTGFQFHNWNGQGLQFNNGTHSNEMTLYDFLTENNTVYDVSKFTFKNVINAYGL